jgi:hypothetical protein
MSGSNSRGAATRKGLLQPRMKAADAADIIWAQTSIWAFESLVVDRSWPVVRWVRCQRRTLHQLLLAHDAHDPKSG